MGLDVHRDGVVLVAGAARLGDQTAPFGQRTLHIEQLQQIGDVRGPTPTHTGTIRSLPARGLLRRLDPLDEVGLRHFLVVLDLDVA